MTNILRRTFVEAMVISALAVLVALFTNAFRSDGLKIFGTDCIKQFKVCKGTIKKSEIIDLEKALALFYNKAAIFVDARSPIVYSMGHIPGALNIPNNGDIKQYEDLVSGFSKDSFFVVYDDGVEGGPAVEVASMLKEKGFSRVLSFPNGFSEWRVKGLPVDVGIGRF
ncbi:MAG: rhodanese-like domain-containing protein [Syntrophobacterales bacterium]|nr:rhodanese-like domain-containing protein [Syntrophobacterales bacterium]